MSSCLFSCERVRKTSLIKLISVKFRILYKAGNEDKGFKLNFTDDQKLQLLPLTETSVGTIEGNYFAMIQSS